MKTKVTILGETEAVKPELKKIEFVKLLSDNLEVEDTYQLPSVCKEIFLLERNYSKGLDLMFATYIGNDDCNCIFLGHFNDGVV